VSYVVHPLPPGHFLAWKCLECGSGYTRPADQTGLELDREAMRRLGKAHAITYGHVVMTVEGTSETFAPMRTEVPGRVLGP
jgi:hypothetical protein